MIVRACMTSPGCAKSSKAPVRFTASGKLLHVNNQALASSQSDRYEDVCLTCGALREFVCFIRGAHGSPSYHNEALAKPQSATGVHVFALIPGSAGNTLRLK